MTIISINACKCGSRKDYAECCQPIHQDVSLVTDVEQLMRARYTAYAMNNLSFIRQTMSGKALQQFVATKDEALPTRWLGLEIHRSRTLKKRGEVEFSVHYFRGTQRFKRRDHSLFKKIDGRWYYVDEKS